VIDILYLDYSNNIQQTLIDENQLRDTPSAHNVWALWLRPKSRLKELPTTRE